MDDSIDQEQEEETVPPAKKLAKKGAMKKIPLKRKVTGPTTSAAIAARNKLNMSLTSSVKATLRSNNRSLARALEMVRQELVTTQQQYLDLQTHQHDCERRMKKRLSDVKAILGAVSAKLINSVSLLDEAQILCTVDPADLDATTNTPTCSDATFAAPPPRPMPPPQRILLNHSPETPSIPAAVATISPDVTVHSPGKGIDEAASTSPVNNIIHNMKSDLTEVVASLQGYKAPAVSIPPVDVSTIMEQSTIMDQLPPMFDEVEEDNATRSRRRCHSRSRSGSRSGRRSAMIYRAGGSLESETTEAETSADEKETAGPRRSLRARSRSRQRSLKTVKGEEAETPLVGLNVKETEMKREEESESSVQPEDMNVESQESPLEDEKTILYVLEPSYTESTKPESTVSKSSAAPQVPEIVLCSEEGQESAPSDSESRCFKPRKEIPRTPPSRPASQGSAVDQENTEIENKTVGIELPKFISLAQTPDAKKAANKKLVVKKKPLKKLSLPGKKHASVIAANGLNMDEVNLLDEPTPPQKAKSSKIMANKDKVNQKCENVTLLQEPGTAEDQDKPGNTDANDEKIEVERQNSESIEQKRKSEGIEDVIECVHDEPRLHEKVEEEVDTTVKVPFKKTKATKKETVDISQHLENTGTKRPKKREQKEEVAEPEIEDEQIYEPVGEVKPRSELPEKRRSITRRGTFCMRPAKTTPADIVTVDDEKEKIKPTNDRPQRQRRGTYCLNDNQVEVLQTTTTKISKQANSKQEKCEAKQKRGTFFVAANQPETEESPEEPALEELPPVTVPNAMAKENDHEAVDDVDDIMNEQDITLVGDDMDDDVLPPAQPVDFAEPCPLFEKPVDPKPLFDETVYDAEDMEMTEVIPSLPLDEKIPVPAFIRKSLQDAEAANLKERERRMKEEKESQENRENERNKENGGKRRTLVLKPKLKKKGKTPKEDGDSKSSGSSTGQTSKEKDSDASEIVDAQVQDESVETDKLDDKETFKKPDFVKPVARTSKSKMQNKPVHESSTDSSSDSEKEKEKPKFQAMSAKPGKIVFKAGRRNVADLKVQEQKVSGNSKAVSNKVKSLLPRPDRPRSKTARSKTRLLSVEKDTKLGFNQQPEKPRINEGPKSVFDMSLNESITVLPQMSYGDFREQNPGMEAMKEALKSTKSQETEPLAGPHGIMLVMGNGKRTKPRMRSKSVTYSENLADIRLRTPSASYGSDDSDTVPSVIKQFAGNTPPKNKANNKKMQLKLNENTEKGFEAELPAFVPETPEAQLSKKTKRTAKAKEESAKSDKSDEPDIRDSVRESICSTRSSILSAAADEANDSVDEFQPPKAKTSKATPKKKLSAAKPAPKCADTKDEGEEAKEMPKSSSKKSPGCKKAKLSVEKKRESSPSSRSSTSSTTTKRSLSSHDEFKVPSADMEPKRPRRGASSVCYKELSLNKKLRRGDPISKSLYKEGEHNMDTQHTKDKTKDRRSGKRSRSVLNTITNVHIDESQ